MFVVLVSGTLSGVVLFVVQRFTVIPLIETAETHEAAQRAGSGLPHEEEGWQPTNGWERTSLTAITTILTGIGFAAILFGTLSLARVQVNARRGALWGLAGFVCFGLAPALGLPPQPPGAAVAGIVQRQVWWISTALATAAGLWFVAGRKRAWPLRLGGVVGMLLPHVIGAPAASGQSAVPVQLIRRFAVTSLAATGLVWLGLGAIGG